MALSLISLGTPPNALDGDDARTAFLKINNNSQFLDTIGVSAPIGRPVPNDDCNQAMTEGWWSAASGTATNRPPGMTFALVYVITIGGYVVQSAVDMFSGRRSGRGYNVANGQWSDWGRESFLTDFGTAAFATLTTSANDANPGRVLKVGDYGIGGNVPNLTSPNLNNLTVPPGPYFVATPTNGPAGIPFYGFLDWKVRSETETQRLTYVGTGVIRTFERIKTDNATGWRAWVETTPFGFGQATNTMTGSRALNVTYTNNSGRAMQVSVSCGPSTGAAQVIAILVNGTSTNRGSYSTGPGQYLNAISMVPPGATYQAVIAGTGGNLDVFEWTELR